MNLIIKQLKVVLLISFLCSGCTFTNKVVYQFKTQIKERHTQVWSKFKKQPIRVEGSLFLPSLTSSDMILVSNPSSFLPPPTFVLSYVPTPTTECIDFEPLESLREDVTLYAKKFLGTRYRSGGRSKKGFDCSNFTSYIMEHFGYKIPAGMAQATHGEQVAFEHVRKGDLLFFGYKSKKTKSYRISHVAMVISDEGEEIKFIHAARRGIVIDDLASPAWRNYYKSRYLFAKRIIEAEKDVTLALKGNEFVPKK
ncbi:MAG: C40 family peptidase [Thermoflexibacter sp.]|nr:C40 family peptidase [Thermoflexibacter sp.]